MRKDSNIARDQVDELQDAEKLVVPSAWDEFVAFMQELDIGQVEQFGAALAMNWVFARRTEVVKTDSTEEKDETGLAHLLADCALTKPSAAELQHVRWDDELVQGLMVGVDEDTEQLERFWNRDAFWMDLDSAIRLFKGGRETSGVSETHGDAMEE